MVEMLGVLAIIGVLSIGGIAGYTMAMNRYKANEVINAAAMLSIANQSSQSEDTIAASSLGIDTAKLACTISATTAGKGAVTISDCDPADLTGVIKNITGGTQIDNDGKWVS
ncbi:MAG: hypothetical protein J6V11_01530, partial [Alphaproteobacteria bacterium]|nr:hypothetical protein [Alphaproteobacteria bacterium]